MNRRHFRRWGIGLAVFFAVYFSLRRTEAAGALWRGAVLPLAQWLSRRCDAVAVSVGEVMILTAVWVAVIWLANVVRQLFTRPRPLQTLAGAALTASCTVATVYALFCLLWGLGYHTGSFQQQSGLAAQPSTVAELTEVTAYFAGQAAESADGVARDGDGACAESRQAILSLADSAYDGLYDEFPFLQQSTGGVKPFACSKALSCLRFTGFYFPFTGEANVNMDSPVAYLPTTVCHEMAHQRGITAEEECNFIGILAATRTDSAAYRYSGWLVGYVHLSNALYRVDYEAWCAIRDTLPEAVLSDLRANSAYWAQYQGAVSQTAQTVYDAFLKSNGDSDGVQSYGMVADLLVTYFK